MGIKKKMSMGILAGALGVSLIGGGTWAAFNDVEEVSNSFTAGTLDLVTSPTEVFNLSNMKPGDSFTKSLTLENKGSLTIKDILISTKVSGWENAGVENSQSEFLEQFSIVVKKSGAPVWSGNLSNIQNVTNSDMFGNAIALESGASATYDFTIEFVENDTTVENSRLHEQNKFQNEGAEFTIKFEAIQDMVGEQNKQND